MTTFEMGHRMLELGQPQDAMKAFQVALRDEANSLAPEQALEAAACVLQNEGDYKLSYQTFVKLYNDGYFQEDILPLMTAAFYEPNIRAIKNRYERNCRLLERYPYIFRRDFPAFEELSVCFIPFDDYDGYTPFSYATARFGETVHLREPVLRHYFFRDLEKPILATDIFSQYELEYLRDNVRPGEYIGKENHIYLHYTDWAQFCAWLQVLNLAPLLESKKFVFLIEGENAEYPIDFKARFDIDYSVYPVRPIGVTEVNKLIWHTQLSTHNGGDFFNEIFDAHPNLICLPSVMMDNAEEMTATLRASIAKARTLAEYRSIFSAETQHIADELFSAKHLTDKDYFVAAFMAQEEWMRFVDPSSRIAPALFFQPHFHNIVYSIHSDRQNRTVLKGDNVQTLHKSKLFKSFKYIKTFTPMRRFTTSHGATVKFMYNSALAGAKEMLGTDKKNVILVVPDAVSQRVLNRSFMFDPDDRLYKDSVVVRLEDGKLNPKATFTALAAFLDLPYTESMTYCSEKGERDPHTDWKDYAAGFSLSSVYRTYDDYVNDSERKYIEYFLRDAYAFYGYDFHYYDGGEVTEETIREWVSDFERIDHYIRETWLKLYQSQNYTITTDDPNVSAEEIRKAVKDQIPEAMMKRQLEGFRNNRIKNAGIMQQDLRFVNMRGKPLQMTPMLALDPALLENEVYH